MQHRRKRLWTLCALVCALSWCSVWAHAATLTYSATVEGASKTASVDAFQADGQAYVSLQKLVSQLGGTIREQPGKVTVDLGGRSAVISLNGTQVSTSSASFALHFPVKEADGGPYVAVEDLTRLFDQGFASAIAPGPAASPEPSATPNDDLEAGMNLLEEVSPATPGAATSAEGATPAETPPLSPTPAPSNGKFVLFLDPGHGGNDPGIVTGGGTAEKDLALAIALQAQRMLASEGNLSVVLSRPDDRDLSLEQRSAAAKEAGATLFVSIHAGGSASPAAHGFEIFIQSAATGSRAISSVLTGESRYQAEQAEKFLTARTGAQSRGVRQAPMRLLSGLQMPALLLEVGMLTTPAEESLLASAAYQEKIAAGLVDLAKQAAAKTAGKS